MGFDPATLAAASAILFAAYFVRGIAGFGSGLIAVPLLALLWPLPFVVPLVLLLDFTASTLMGGLNLQHVRRDEILPLLPLSVVGVVLGTQLLVGLPQTPMLLALALFVAVFGLRSLLALSGERPVSRWWSLPASFTGGTVGGLFGTGGPPYVIYLTHRLADKHQLRASLSALFFFEGLVRIASFVVAGLLASAQLWLAFAAALPLVLAALWWGGRVHTGLTRTQITRGIGAILLLAAASLGWKALA